MWKLKQVRKHNPAEAGRLRRKISIRKRVRGTLARPRLSVFRSAMHIYAQVIDDVDGRTLAAASSLDEAVRAGKLKKVDAARRVGGLLAERCKAKEIRAVVFDRNGFLYHGRVRAVADGAREGGLDF